LADAGAAPASAVAAASDAIQAWDLRIVLFASPGDRASRLHKTGSGRLCRRGKTLRNVLLRK
jgi:hypothetical protein